MYFFTAYLARKNFDAIFHSKWTPWTLKQHIAANFIISAYLSKTLHSIIFNPVGRWNDVWLCRDCDYSINRKCNFDFIHSIFENSLWMTYELSKEKSLIFLMTPSFLMDVKKTFITSMCLLDCSDKNPMNTSSVIGSSPFQHFRIFHISVVYHEWC